MQFNASLTGDAAELARQHDDVLARLPATLHAFILVELQKWPMLFAPEQRYQRALLEHLSRVPRRALGLEGTNGSEAFLQALFGARAPGGGTRGIFASAASAPLDAWLIESHEALHALCDAKEGESSAGALTGLSYDRLRGYRDD